MSKIKVFVRPVGLYSRAMVRIADALTLYAPDNIKIVDNESDCDISVLYVIGFDYIDRADKLLSQGRQYVAMQCCVNSTIYTDETQWADFWNKSLLVWSYLDLHRWIDDSSKFYYASLGVDMQVFNQLSCNLRERLVITTGYTSGESAEAIEEVWIAARRCGVKVVHIGPHTIEGIDREWVKSIPEYRHNISDNELANLYRRALWVAALRHTEGFELPALEGLACGAAPIIFDQLNMRHWYRDSAIYIPDINGEGLINELMNVFNRNIIIQNQSLNLAEFDWSVVCGEFWSRLITIIERG